MCVRALLLRYHFCDVCLLVFTVGGLAFAFFGARDFYCGADVLFDGCCCTTTSIGHWGGLESMACGLFSRLRFVTHRASERASCEGFRKSTSV